MRAAVEAALAQLKAQAPAVLTNRRERSLARALPALADALAGILLRGDAPVPGCEEEQQAGGDGDEGGSVLEQACALADCPPEGLAGALGRLLEAAVGAAQGGEGGDDEGGSKRARTAAASQPEP